jgi:hypothetical protein
MHAHGHVTRSEGRGASSVNRPRYQFTDVGNRGGLADLDLHREVVMHILPAECLRLGLASVGRQDQFALVNERDSRPLDANGPR